MTVVAVKKTEKSIHLACDTMLSYWRWHTSKTTGSSNIKDFSKIGAINDITYWFSGYIEDMLWIIKKIYRTMSRRCLQRWYDSLHNRTSKNRVRTNKGWY